MPPSSSSLSTTFPSPCSLYCPLIIQIQMIVGTNREHLCQLWAPHHLTPRPIPMPILGIPTNANTWHTTNTNSNTWHPDQYQYLAPLPVQYLTPQPIPVQYLVRGTAVTLTVAVKTLTLEIVPKMKWHCPKIQGGFLTDPPPKKKKEKKEEVKVCQT